MIKKVLFLLLLFLVPSIVQASSINYDITNFLIDATIKENGDLDVQELIVLDGNFYGYVRELQYRTNKLEDYEEGNVNFANSAIYNAEGISNVVIKTRNVTNEKISFDTFQKEFSQLSKVVNEKTAKDGNYIYRKDDNILSYKMYQSANDEKIAFLLSYTIDKAVVLHEDIAELYWTFINSGNLDDLNNVQIQIHLPEKVNQEKLHVWFHGDINSENKQIDETTFLSSMKSLDRKSVIDARVIFSKDIIENQERLRNSKMIAYEKIWNLEEELIEKTNKQKEFYRLVEEFTKGLTIFYYISLMILWLFIYNKFDREYKSTFHSKYYQDFIDDYSIEVIDYLMNKKVTPNAMSASIMNLVLKENIKIEYDEKVPKNYQFFLNNNKNVTDTEQMLLDFLFEQIGKDNKFTMHDLEKYASSPKTSNQFFKYYSEWETCVIKDAEREKFFETNGIPTVLGILTLLITILIFMVVVYYHVKFIPCYFLLPTGISFLFYTILIKKKTRKGNEDYLHWIAFKNYLNHFEKINFKDLPEINLWPKYLAYATVLGVSELVEQEMIKIKNENELSSKTTEFYLNNLVHSKLSKQIYDSVSISEKIMKKKEKNLR